MSVVPANAPPVYINDRLIVYAFVEKISTSSDHQASAELYTGQHRLGEAKVNRVPNVSYDGTIARLAAKAFILELQRSKLSLPTMKKCIVELLLKHSILGLHTAFFGY